VSGWRAVVFDLDDTLYPERDYVLSGFRAVAGLAEQRFGLQAEAAYAELSKLFEQGVRGDTFNRWLEARGLDQELVAEMLRCYREHLPQLRPFAEMPELLRSLGRRHRLGLISDGPLEVQRRKLTALRLGEVFQSIIFTDELGREHWKPSTLPFELALQQLGAAPGEAVYVADNPAKDFLGARRAGLVGIRIRRPSGIYAQLEPPSDEHAPEVELSSARALPEMLERLREA
jgi:putative hydrolase of the HAD superfamily